MRMKHRARTNSCATNNRIWANGNIGINYSFRVHNGSSNAIF